MCPVFYLIFDLKIFVKMELKEIRAFNSKAQLLTNLLIGYLVFF